MNKLKFILSMLIFGTIGVFVRYIPLPSSAVALARALIGVIFLAFVMLVRKSRISFISIKNNFVKLLIAGVFLGANWILLFEAYRYTTVASATLCYYLAPAFMIIASPFVLKEKLSAVKVVCVIISLIGMVFVSGAFESTFALSQIKGVALGIGAATLYAAIVLLNKKIKNISSFDMTVFELFVSAAVLLPYVFLTEDFSGVSLSANSVLILLLVGVLHTGIAYLLYFDSITKLQGSTVALFSYIDPVCAVILSAFLLKEKFTVYSFVGAVLILGASVFGELKGLKKSS